MSVPRWRSIIATEVPMIRASPKTEARAASALLANVLRMFGARQLREGVSCTPEEPPGGRV